MIVTADKYVMKVVKLIVGNVVVTHVTLTVDGLQHVEVNNVVVAVVIQSVGPIAIGNVIDVLELFVMSAATLSHVVVVLQHAQVDRVLM